MELQEEFAENWRSRQEIDHEVRGELPEYWSGIDKKYYLVCPLDEVREELADVLSGLKRYGGVETYRTDFLHLTVKMFGEERPDAERVEDAVSGFDRFKVEFGGLNVFPQVVFLEALAPEVRTINTALLEEGFSRRLHDGGSYLPHVSLAQYSSKNWKNILQQLSELKPVEVRSIQVEELLLASDDLSELQSYNEVERFSL
ncbi:MAG: 2'-5' RNA ligase family protein [Candidatus Nanohaloarchaea archaeon]